MGKKRTMVVSDFGEYERLRFISKMALFSSSPSVCPNSKGCRLFPIFKMNSLLHVWQTSYCEDDYSRCERYKLHACGAPVADNMLPNGKMLGGNLGD